MAARIRPWQRRPPETRPTRERPARRLFRRGLRRARALERRPDVIERRGSRQQRRIRSSSVVPTNGDTAQRGTRSNEWERGAGAAAPSVAPAAVGQANYAARNASHPG